MTQQGTIRQWNDDKGYGFIELDDKHSSNQAKSDDLFFHISEYRAPDRPHVGEAVVFDIGTGKNGKPQAKNVQGLAFVKKQQQAQKKRQDHQDAFESGQRRNLATGVMFYIVLILFAWKGLMPWAVLGWYVLIGLATFAIYFKDKKSAQSGAWRTPEKTLHLLAVLGGWVGAMLAQTYLRHKSSKAEFRMVYYFTVLINLAGLLYLVFGGIR